MIDSAAKTAGIQKKKKNQPERHNENITDQALRTPTSVLVRFPGCSDETNKHMYTLNKVEEKNHTHCKMRLVESQNQSTPSNRCERHGSIGGLTYKQI